MKNTSVQRCGNCKHLDRSVRTDLAGIVIAPCRHPEGTEVDGVVINGDFVEMNATCAKQEHGA
jgi:hypothetical protein